MPFLTDIPPIVTPKIGVFFFVLSIITFIFFFTKPKATDECLLMGD